MEEYIIVNLDKVNATINRYDVGEVLSRVDITVWYMIVVLSAPFHLLFIFSNTNNGDPMEAKE